MKLSRWMFLPMVCAVTLSHAQTDVANFPERPVRLVVPYSAGGGMDVVARMIARTMGGVLGKTMVVENMPGAGTALGAGAVARAKPDGYTILWGDNATFALNKYLYKNLSYDPKTSFKPISLTMTGAVTLAVSKSSNIKSVADFLAQVRAAPGKFSYGSAGSGSPHHLAMEKLKLETGLDLVHVPYKGEAPGVTDLMSGQIEAMFLGDTMSRRVQESGQGRLLATAGAQRNPLFPDLPTLAEAGIPKFDSSFWHAIVVPAGTPDAIVAKLHDAYAKALADPDLIKALKTNNPGLTFRVTSPKETATFMQEELIKAGELVKAIKLDSL
jgi:tripartite-type tricarboxylate transporter receptor subunit TctC